MTLRADEEARRVCCEGGKLTDLVVVEVIQTLEGEVLLLDLLDHLLRQLLELSQRRHRLPPVDDADKESISVRPRQAE